VLSVRELFCSGVPVSWDGDGAGNVAVRLGDDDPIQVVVRHRGPVASDATVAVVRLHDALVVAEWEADPGTEEQSDASVVASAVATLQVPSLQAGKPALVRDEKDDRADDRDAWERVHIDPTLPKAVQRQVRQVLKEHWQSFTLRAVPPVMRGVVHHIALKPGADLSTARDAMRRLSPERQEAVSKLLEQLESAGRTVEMPSLAAAVPVVVQKTDDQGKFAGWRVAVDFRRLNQLSVVEAYPMPSVDDIVRGAARFPRRSKFDAKACYHAIPLDVESVPLTGTWFGPGRQLCWKVAPFGLASIPQTLQRAVDKAFRDVPRCWPYMDDIVLGHEQVGALAGDVRAMLEAADKLGMTLSPGKCWVGYESLPILGFEVGHESVRATEQRAATLRDWPTPTTPRELRRFLGMAQVFVGHVPGFQEMASEVRPWTSKGPAEFTSSWGHRQDQVYDELRTALYNMVSHAPLRDGKVRLETDFSAQALGWILSQEQDGVRRIVDAGSKACNAWEQQYGPMDGEVAALACALRKLEHLGLAGREIEWHTDNRPATDALFSGHRSKARIRRTAAFLTRFNIVPTHVAGATLPADALSRLKEHAPAAGEPEPEVTDEEVHHFAEVMAVHGAEVSQRAPEVEPAQRQAYLQELHGRVHHSASSMVRAARRTGTWPGLSTDVKKWVEACVVCQRGATFKDKRQVGRATTSTTRGDEWELDLMFVDGRPVLTGREVATGFYVAELLPDKSAAATWEACQHRIILAHGTPARFRTDPGKEFGGEFLAGCRQAGIEVRPTPVGDNNPIGGVERAHGTLDRWIRNLRLEDGESVPLHEHLAEAVAELNALVKEGTSVSPFEAWTGRPWRPPAQGPRRKRQVMPTEEGEPQQRAVQVAERAQAGVNDIQRGRAVQNERDAERRGRPMPRQVGDIVRYLPKARDRVKPEKVWLGPFRIDRVREGARAYDLVPLDVVPGMPVGILDLATMLKVSSRFIESWPDAALPAGQDVTWQANRARRRDRWYQQREDQWRARVHAAESALVRQAEQEAAARQQAAEEAIRDINAQTLEEQKRLTQEVEAARRRLDRARSESERERAAADLSRAERARARVQRVLRSAKRGGEKVRKLVTRRQPQPQG